MAWEGHGKLQEGLPPWKAWSEGLLGIPMSLGNFLPSVSYVVKLPNTKYNKIA